MLDKPYAAGGIIKGPPTPACEHHDWGEPEHILRRSPGIGITLDHVHVSICNACFRVRHLGACECSAAERQRILSGVFDA